MSHGTGAHPWQLPSFTTEDEDLQLYYYGRVGLEMVVEEKDWWWGWPFGVAGEEKPCQVWWGGFANLMEEEDEVCLVLGKRTGCLVTWL
ncbi:hypothetical protein ACFX11_030524 [Malus domestica]